MLSWIKITFLSLLFTASLVGGYYIFHGSFFNLSDIEITYTEASDYTVSLNERILDSVEKYKNLPLWKINLAKLEDELRAQNWVQGVTISRQYPSSLEVQITPKKIIANIVRSPTKMIPIAEDSQMLPITNHKNAPDVPLLIGKDFLRNQSLRESALKLLKDLPQDGSFSSKNISEMTSRKNEFAIRIKGSSASILMNTEDVPVKAARVAKVVDYLNERDLNGRVIDTNFSKKVLVKLRNDR